MIPRSVLISRWLLVLAVLFAGVTPARAQSGDEVQVDAVQYGLGDVAREGDWAGIQVNVLDSAPEQRDILLRVSVRDADGDRANYDRVVTSNPGVEQSFWLYARLPFGSAGEPPPILVFEAIETDGARVRPGRLLGRYDPQIGAGQKIIQPSFSIIAAVGPYPAGLDQYGYTVNSNIPAVPFGHEPTRFVPGRTIPMLPDHWQGLVAVDALVWTESTTSVTEPSALTPERARAIRAWVERGGHLIIVLPPAGDPWFGAAHPLSDLLPDVRRPRRIDGFDLDRLRPLLTESVRAPLPRNAVIQTFTPSPDAEPGDARPVLTTPDGDCVVVQRIVGTGAVTVIGIDLTAGPLRRFNLPDAEAFWHRVLGRRADIRRAEELTQQERSDAGSRTQVSFDHDISSQIDSTGRAVQGVLYGLVVFITYWLVAGPVGFMLLKKRNMQHHAWVAFAACTAVFTALAWAGATALRPGRVEVTHLTLLETVHGQAISRARTWASVMLPDYGQATISLDDPGADDRSGNLLAPWDAPGVVGFASGFPDNTGYAVDARSPDTLGVPTRATVKQVRADSAGETPWSGITLQRDPARVEEPRITIEGLALSGTIVHDLPGPLRDVRVIVCQGQVPLRAAGAPLAGLSPTRTLVFATRFPDGQWGAGVPFDLASVVNTASIQDALRVDYFRGAVRDGINASSLNPTAGRPLTDRLVSARFMSMFAPPNYGDDRDMVANRLAQRVSTHGWDLGRWLTSPCVIVTGFVEIDARDASAGAMPFPFYVDGRAAPAHGLTMVTWIYPLQPSPPAWPELAPPQPTPTDAEQSGDMPAGQPADDE